jgi:hypothetical protein
LSAFFLVSSSATFFVEIPGAARQEIAELFSALILLLLVRNEIRGGAKTRLLLVFSFSLLVSHYALTVIYMGIFLTTAVGLELIEGARRPSQSLEERSLEAARRHRPEQRQSIRNVDLDLCVFVYGGGACLVRVCLLWHNLHRRLAFATVLLGEIYQ